MAAEVNESLQLLEYLLKTLCDWLHGDVKYIGECLD